MFNKLISKLVLFLIVVGISAPLVFAQWTTETSTTPTDTTLIDAKAKEDKLGSFKVSDWLKIPDGQTYLDSGTPKDGTKTTLKNGLVYFVIKIIELLTKIIGSFALLFLITGGLILMASHGNSQLQTRGKQMILYSILGIVIAFGSLIIVTFVQSLFFTA
ncbi:hypothetical protein C0416_00260 [bacterium]|nr:hypothetical protein [bacterium]